LCSETRPNAKPENVSCKCKMTDREKNYIERHRNWQDIAIEQLSFTNNFLLTISTGLLVFSIDKEIFSQIKFCLCICEIDKSLTFYSFSLLFIILSISTGIIVLISRLYDFRLSRHITLVRQRFYQKNEERITDEDKNAAILAHDDFENPNLWQKIATIFKVIFVKIQFLDKNEMQTTKSDFPKKKFKTIRELSYRLGTISWKWTKLQGLYFLIGTILYGLYLWTK
jgi:hypothetical protein